MTIKDNDDLSLAELYLKLKKTFDIIIVKKNTVILAGFIGALLGLTLSILYPVKYKGDITFIVEEAGGSSGLASLAGLASTMGIGGLSGDGGLYDNTVNLMSYLKTRFIIEEALLTEIPNTKKTFAQEFIETYKWDFEMEVSPGKIQKLSFPIHDNREKFPIIKDSLLKEMYQFLIEDKNVEFSKPEIEGSIVKVEVKTKSKLFSRYFSEELLKIVSAKYISDKTKKERYNVDIIQKQADSVRDELNASLLKAASVTDQVFGLNPALNVARVPESKEQIDIQVSSLVMGEMLKTLELSKVQLLHTTPLIEIIDRPKFPLEIIKISKTLGILVGGILFGFLTILYLFLRKFIQDIKAEATQISNNS